MGRRYRACRTFATAHAACAPERRRFCTLEDVTTRPRGSGMRPADSTHFLRRLSAAARRRAKEVPAVGRILAAAAAAWLRGRSPQPEAIVHAGEHKTGTTSVQAILRSERESFQSQGIHIVRAGQGTDGAHHRLIYALLGRSRSRATMALLRAEIAHAPPRTVLISSETVKKAIVEGQGERLIDGLRAAGAARVRLLLYLRSPFGLVNSSYSSHTSRLGLAGATFAGFLREHGSGSAYRYDRFLELARRDDVDLVVRPYGASARLSIVGDFAGGLGIDLAGAQEPRHNSSYGPVGLEAMRIIALEGESIPEARRRRLLEPLRHIARSLDEQPFWGIGPSEEAVLAEAERRTEAFALAVWGRGWREAIGEERRPLNVFDPADPRQQSLLDDAVGNMRRECIRILGRTPARRFSRFGV
jgi:hypothetical protein